MFHLLMVVAAFEKLGGRRTGVIQNMEQAQVTTQRQVQVKSQLVFSRRSAPTVYKHSASVAR